MHPGRCLFSILSYETYALVNEIVDAGARRSPKGQDGSQGGNRRAGRSCARTGRIMTGLGEA
jgi:hypothetical protein